jgi:hypothetical protein
MDGANSPDSQFHSQSGFSISNLKERLTSQRSVLHLPASDRVGSNFDPRQEGLTLLPSFINIKHGVFEAGMIGTRFQDWSEINRHAAFSQPSQSITHEPEIWIRK